MKMKTKLPLQNQISTNLQGFFSILHGTEGLMDFHSFEVKSYGRTEKGILFWEILKCALTFL